MASGESGAIGCNSANGENLDRCSSTRILRRRQQFENFFRLNDGVVRQRRQVEFQRIVVVGFVSPPSQTIQDVGDALTFADFVSEKVSNLGVILGSIRRLKAKHIAAVVPRMAERGIISAADRRPQARLSLACVARRGLRKLTGQVEIVLPIKRQRATVGG